jgi:hypothetical protein
MAESIGELTEGDRVYCDAFQEWMEIGSRDSGARTLGAHLYLRIAEHVRRQAAAELTALADRRTGMIKSALVLARELITPGTSTRIIEQRRGTIAPDR